MEGIKVKVFSAVTGFYIGFAISPVLPRVGDDFNEGGEFFKVVRAEWSMGSINNTSASILEYHIHLDN